MNKTLRSVWNARKQTYVAAAESVDARGEPCSGSKLLAAVATVLGGAFAQASWRKARLRLNHFWVSASLAF